MIAELALDPEDEFAHPVTDEVLRAADVIVTMGHSVGVIDLPDGVRHEDWRVGDPIGRPWMRCGGCEPTSSVASERLLVDLGVLDPTRGAISSLKRDAVQLSSPSPPPKEM